MKPELQKRIQRYGWDKAADYYEPFWQQQLRPAQERLLAMADLQPGERVLDVACGTGLVTLPAGAAVGDSGEVLGVDISEDMLSAAKNKAGRQNLMQVSFIRKEAETLGLPEESFHAALCSLGLMYIPHPVEALREMFRVLVPGGRTVVSVWGARGNCGWAPIFPIVDRRVKSEVCPLFFQLGTGNALEKALEKAGFINIQKERFSTTLHYDSAEDAVAAAFEAGAVALAYRRFDHQTREEAHAEYIEAIDPFRKGDEYDIPGEFVVAKGYRQEKE